VIGDMSDNGQYSPKIRKKLRTEGNKRCQTLNRDEGIQDGVLKDKIGPNLRTVPYAKTIYTLRISNH